MAVGSNTRGFVNAFWWLHNTCTRSCARESAVQLTLLWTMGRCRYLHLQFTTVSTVTTFTCAIICTSNNLERKNRTMECSPYSRLDTRESLLHFSFMRGVRLRSNCTPNTCTCTSTYTFLHLVAQVIRRVHEERHIDQTLWTSNVRAFTYTFQKSHNLDDWR